MGVKDEVLKKIKDILKVPVTNKDKNEALAAARVYFGTDIAHLANWTKYTQDINLIHWQDPEITWQNATPFHAFFANIPTYKQSLSEAVRKLNATVDARLTLQVKIDRIRKELDEVIQTREKNLKDANYKSVLWPLAQKQTVYLEELQKLQNDQVALFEKMQEQQQTVVEIRDDIVNVNLANFNVSPLARLDFLYQYFDEQVNELLNQLQTHNIPAAEWQAIKQQLVELRASLPTNPPSVRLAIPHIMKQLTVLRHYTPHPHVTFNGVFERMCNNLDALDTRLKEEIDFSDYRANIIQKQLRVKYTSANDSTFALYDEGLQKVDEMLRVLNNKSHYLVGASLRSNIRDIRDWELFRYQLEEALYKSQTPQKKNDKLVNVPCDKDLLRQHLKELTNLVAPRQFKNKQLMKSVLTDLIAVTKKPSNVDTAQSFTVPAVVGTAIKARHNARQALFNAQTLIRQANEVLTRGGFTKDDSFSQTILPVTQALHAVMSHATGKAHQLHASLMTQEAALVEVNKAGKVDILQRSALRADIARLKLEIIQADSAITQYHQLVRALHAAFKAFPSKKAGKDSVDVKKCHKILCDKLAQAFANGKAPNQIVADLITQVTVTPEPGIKLALGSQGMFYTKSRDSAKNSPSLRNARLSK